MCEGSRGQVEGDAAAFGLSYCAARTGSGGSSKEDIECVCVQDTIGGQ